MAWALEAMTRRLVATTLVLLLLLQSVEMVKHGDFKTAAQSGFTRRNRALADAAKDAAAAAAGAGSWTSPYSVAGSTFEPGHWHLDIRNARAPAGTRFAMSLYFFQGGLTRMTMDEVDGLQKRYDEAGLWTIAAQPILDREESHFVLEQTSDSTAVAYHGPDGALSHKVKIYNAPLMIEFLRDDQIQMRINGDGLFNMEHHTTKEAWQAASQANESSSWLPMDAWEETFGGKTDTKRRGPESHAFDLVFPGFAHVYGIPEHASPLSLRTTRGEDERAYKDPYRLYNTDVFEYEPDSPMTLYGAIPIMFAQRPGSTVALFSMQSSELWVDVTKRASSASDLRNLASASPNAKAFGTTTHTHWMHESGIMDLYIFLGPDAPTIHRQFGALTGYTAMPQLFAIGYHQCRWNYISEEDVLQVDQNFDQADIPYDVLWLDVEYTEEKKYMVWDKKNFPEPERLVDALAAKQRHLVAIVDPHLKKVDDYPVYAQAKKLDLLIKNPDGKTDYEGWCWPGTSVWVDFFKPASTQWWIDLFKLKAWPGNTDHLWIWNDMNEPSIFNGPEITMQKDNIHHGGWEHRDVHNINGLLFHNATAQGLIAREPQRKRPFVLSRSFWAGTQRVSAIWTGDNLGTWEHLAGSIPMILANGIAGMTFAGADVGGFFGNPSEEMLVRWYQAGIFYPFFRAHAHLDTKRREPFLFDEPTRGMLRAAIQERYKLLPMWYTAFREASTAGMPIARPQFLMFPNDVEGYAIDDQFHIGSSGLLVKPVTREGATETEVYLADSETYYDYFTYQAIAGPGRVKVSAPLDKIPLSLRAGSIVPKRERPRRSARLMANDPFTLMVALSPKGAQSALGSLYLDDGETFGYEDGDYIEASFEYDAGRLYGRNHNTRGLSKPWVERVRGNLRVERVVILGLAHEPRRVYVDDEERGGSSKSFTWTAADKKLGRASRLVIKDPAVLVATTWSMTIE